MKSVYTRYIWAPLISLLCLGLLLTQGFCQESSASDLETQTTLVSWLNSGDQEKRMDAILRLCGIFSAAPGSADFSTVTALALTMRNDISPVVRAMAARALE